MSNENIIELQKLDCNCNDCLYLIRDQGTLHKYDALYDELHGGHKQSWRIHYGFCSKFNNKKIQFTPGQCQLHTQECFKHRREYKLVEELI